MRASAAIITPISQMRKLRPGDVKELLIKFSQPVTIYTGESGIPQSSFILLHNLAQGSPGIIKLTYVKASWFGQLKL